MRSSVWSYYRVEPEVHRRDLRGWMGHLEQMYSDMKRGRISPEDAYETRSFLMSKSLQSSS